jgi:hypothetical protein
MDAESKFVRTALLFLLILVCAFVTAKDIRVAESTPPLNQQQRDGSLWLTLKLVSSQYCTGDDEIDGLLLKLRFVYENRGTGPVILYKNPPTPTRVMISRSLRDAAAQQYELDFSLTWYSEKASDQENKCYKGAAPTDCFVTIPAGNSYEADGDVRVFAVRGDVADVPGAVKSGEHALRLVVPTWEESGKLAQELTSRWRSNGRLWSEPLTSDPLAFTVDKERKVVECK